MAGTTRQIFDQLQGSSGMVSPIPAKQTAFTASRAVTGQDEAAILGKDPQLVTYFATKGLTQTLFDQARDSSGNAGGKAQKASDKAVQSAKDFSPRMQVTDSYRAANVRLEMPDPAQAAYDEMYAIQSQPFIQFFDDCINASATAHTSYLALEAALVAHPPVIVPANPAAVPPTTGSVTVDPAVDAAIADYVTKLQVLANDKLMRLANASDAIVISDDAVVTKFTKFISNAYLAQALPSWYADTTKKSSIDKLATPALKALIQ